MRLEWLPNPSMIGNQVDEAFKTIYLPVKASLANIGNKSH